MYIETKLPRVGTTIFTVMSQLALDHGAVHRVPGLGDGFKRAVDEHLAACFVEVSRQHGYKRRRALELVGHLADGAEEVGLGVGEVGLFGDQVVARLGHPRFGLIEVGTTADAALGAQLNLEIGRAHV